MNPYIVFIRHRNEDDLYLYTIQAKSAAKAGLAAWEAFVAEFAPQNYRDYRTKVFDPVFTGLPVRVCRVDREV